MRVIDLSHVIESTMPVYSGIRVTKEAQRERTFRKLPYEINTGIVIPWLERFALLIDKMTAENLRIKSEFAEINYGIT